MSDRFSNSILRPAQNQAISPNNNKNGRYNSPNHNQRNFHLSNNFGKASPSPQFQQPYNYANIHQSSAPASNQRNHAIQNRKRLHNSSGSESELENIATAEDIALRLSTENHKLMYHIEKFKKITKKIARLGKMAENFCNHSKESKNDNTYLSSDCLLQANISFENPNDYLKINNNAVPGIAPLSTYERNNLKKDVNHSNLISNVQQYASSGAITPLKYNEYSVLHKEVHSGTKSLSSISNNLNQHIRFDLPNLMKGPYSFSEDNACSHSIQRQENLPQRAAYQVNEVSEAFLKPKKSRMDIFSLPSENITVPSAGWEPKSVARKAELKNLQFTTVKSPNVSRKVY